VLHGDVELRNALWRERDGAVLWVDLEFAELRDEVAEFAAAAEREVAKVACLLEGVVEEETPRSETPPLSQRTRSASKKCKVLPLCCV